MQDKDALQFGDNKVHLRRRSLKGRPKLCPNCLTQMHLHGFLSGWMTPEEYLCEACGYHGHVALEPLPQEAQSEEEE
jgi:hypothetical protein